ncbi:MAG: MFS transporter [Planctomycetota bacterium]|jgi:DHA1 family multidrug resistance protein-like MFS transporter|nr:MFS transporter [Planctomycetota bacterium]
MPRGKPAAAAAKPVDWKTNLAAIWLSQFLSLTAFSFALPFFPLYIKEKGIVPAGDAQFWSAVFFASAPISLMIMSPIWGVLGDKYGRKMMLVRANLGGGFALYLMGLVDNIEALLVLRLFQGAFTGTTPAAQTLVATNTPDRNQGFAMGLLMAGVSAGNSAGLYFGGICAQYYGPVFSFKISGVLLFLSTFLVVFAVREKFVPPIRLPGALSKSARIRRRRESVNNFLAGLPVLLIIGFGAYVQTFDPPFLSLFIDSLFRQGAEARAMTDAAITSEVYGITGKLSLLSTVGAMIGSILAGVVMDRRMPIWTWGAVAALSGAGGLWIFASPSLLSVALGRGLYQLFLSSLASSLIVILSRLTPSPKRGAALGWSVTVRSVGWIFAPVSGAICGQYLGWRESYGIIALLCLLQTPMFLYLTRRYASVFHPEEDDPPSLDSIGESCINSPSGHGKPV